MFCVQSLITSCGSTCGAIYSCFYQPFVAHNVFPKNKNKKKSENASLIHLNLPAAVVTVAPISLSDVLTFASGQVI